MVLGSHSCSSGLAKHERSGPLSPSGSGARKPAASSARKRRARESDSDDEDDEDGEQLEYEDHVDMGRQTDETANIAYDAAEDDEDVPPPLPTYRDYQET